VEWEAGLNGHFPPPPSLVPPIYTTQLEGPEFPKPRLEAMALVQMLADVVVYFSSPYHAVKTVSIFHVFFRLSAVNGGSPVSMSYMRAPSDHQSTALPCPLRVNISGAIYSMVPQKVCVWMPS